jgi:hypothetical protein
VHDYIAELTGQPIGMEAGLFIRYKITVQVKVGTVYVGTTEFLVDREIWDQFQKLKNMPHYIPVDTSHHNAIQAEQMRQLDERERSLREQIVRTHVDQWLSARVNYLYTQHG